MLRNLLILPDGTELFSGTDASHAIQSVTLTQSVNADGELTPGSVCAGVLEAKLITPQGGLDLTAGDEVTLYRVEDSGVRHKQGIYILEKPTRATANTMQITGYDRMIRLDKDLTDWLAGLTGWPYNILTFAAMVCHACGVSFVPADSPNQDFSVEKFSASGITGRQLMKWVGQVLCSFCRADAQGKITLGWYAPLTTHAIGYRQGLFDEIAYDGYEGELTLDSPDILAGASDGAVALDSHRFTVADDGNGNVTLQLSGCIETVPYFQKGLSYEQYDVLPVEAAQLQLSHGEQGYRWPQVAEGANVYVISGNPLLSSISDSTRKALDNILDRLAQVSYTPCRVSVPATLEIRAGDILSVTDKNGKVLTVYAMTATTAGQKLTLTCTGSHRRDSAEAVNDPSQQQMAWSMAQKAVEGQTQQDIFNKLTQNGKLQGLYMEDGQLYVNASYLMSGIIDAAVVQVVNLVAERLRSVAGDAELQIDGAMLRFLQAGKETIGLSSSTRPIFYLTDHENGTAVSNAELSAHHLKVGGTSVAPLFEIAIQNGAPVMKLSGGDYKRLSWQKNGDGSFTLIGK